MPLTLRDREPFFHSNQSINQWCNRFSSWKSLYLEVCATKATHIYRAWDTCDFIKCLNLRTEGVFFFKSAGGNLIDTPYISFIPNYFLLFCYAVDASRQRTFFSFKWNWFCCCQLLEKSQQPEDDFTRFLELPFMAYTGRLCPKRIGKLSFRWVKRLTRANRGILCREKVEETLWY